MRQYWKYLSPKLLKDSKIFSTVKSTFYSKINNAYIYIHSDYYDGIEFGIGMGLKSLPGGSNYNPGMSKINKEYHKIEKQNKTNIEKGYNMRFSHIEIGEVTDTVEE